MLKIAELNPKLVKTAVLFLVGLLIDYISKQLNFEIPAEVKLTFTLIIVGVIGHYSRILYTHEFQKFLFEEYEDLMKKRKP